MFSEVSRWLDIHAGVRIAVRCTRMRPPLANVQNEPTAASAGVLPNVQNEATDAGADVLANVQNEPTAA